jgi:hypothetical protein
MKRYVAFNVQATAMLLKNLIYAGGCRDFIAVI